MRVGSLFRNEKCGFIRYFCKRKKKRIQCIEHGRRKTKTYAVKLNKLQDGRRKKNCAWEWYEWYWMIRFPYRFPFFLKFIWTNCIVAAHYTCHEWFCWLFFEVLHTLNAIFKYISFSLSHNFAARLPLCTDVGLNVAEVQ